MLSAPSHHCPLFYRAMQGNRMGVIMKTVAGALLKASPLTIAAVVEKERTETQGLLRALVERWFDHQAKYAEALRTNLLTARGFLPINTVTRELWDAPNCWSHGGKYQLQDGFG